LPFQKVEILALLFIGMKRKALYSRNNLYFIAGVFFLILEAIVIFVNLDAGRPMVLFWFCNHIPLFLSFAFFSRNTALVKAFISVGLIAQALWTIDFIGKVFFDTFVFGYSKYVFGIQGFELFVPIIIHMFSIAIAFLATLREKTDKRVLLYAFVYLVVLQAITLAITLPEDNINCVQKICGFESINLPHYSFIWSILVFLILVLPAYLLQVLIYNKLYKKSNAR